MIKFRTFNPSLSAMLLILSILCPKTLGDDVDSNASQPVSAKMTLLWDTATAGGTVDLLLTINVAAPAHIYAQNEPANRSTPMSIKLNLPKGVTIAKDWLLPSPIKTSNGDLIYIGSNQARCTLKLSPTVSARTLHIRAQMRYQACTDEACWPPETLHASITITPRSAPR